VNRVQHTEFQVVKCLPKLGRVVLMALFWSRVVKFNLKENGVGRFYLWLNRIHIMMAPILHNIEVSSF